MPTLPELSPRPQILYSCYHSRSREGEQFVAEHILSFQIAGILTTYDGHAEQVFRPGDLRLSKRNHLVKFSKQPPETAISIPFHLPSTRKPCAASAANTATTPRSTPPVRPPSWRWP